MFNADFYPTKKETLEDALTGYEIAGKVCFDPEGGKGNIVEYLQEQGAKDVISCEINQDLKKILQTKCPVIADDFLTVTSDQISHVELIVMNPPFSADEKHILHAYEIAPKGCKIVAFCNLNTIKNTYTSARKQLLSIVETCGCWEDIGSPFEDAERRTGVEVAVIHLQKPGENYNTEFEGFFMDDDPEEQQENGIMSYNVVRDLVNRYVEAVKIFDRQLNVGVQMRSITSTFFKSQLGFEITENGAPKARNDFKKDLQRSGWNWIFDKMNLQKYATRGLRGDINKFVEQQQNIPFTMRNIYHMLDLVVQTAGQRMDKAILEAFDRITSYHDDNKHNLPGWKTNSHYLLTKKFIIPNMVSPATEYGYTSPTYNVYRSSYNAEVMEDLEKAICFVLGRNYDEMQPLYHVASRKSYSEWQEDHEFFKYKAYKKGTMHFEFKDPDIWAKFNQRIAKLKGYPLFEGKKQTKYQERQTGRAQQEKKNPAHAFKPTVLFEIKVA